MSSKFLSARNADRTNSWERFLYIGRSTSATNLQRQQQDDDAWIAISSRIDRISVFSRLALLAAVVDVTETPHQIQLILYRPISLTTLLEVCNKWTLANAGDIVCLFDHESYLEVKRPGRHSFYRPISGNIAALCIKPEAFIFRPQSTSTTAYIPPLRNGKWCDGRVIVADGVDVSGTRQTLEMILDYPGRKSEPGNDLCHVPRSKIRLECPSYVLDLVTETVSCWWSRLNHALIYADSPWNVKDSRLSKVASVRLQCRTARSNYS